MRLGLLTAMAVLTLGVPAGKAWAGGVVIDFRELGMVSDEAAASGEGLGGTVAPNRPISDPMGRHTPRGPDGDESRPARSAEEPNRTLEMAERQRQIELQELIHAGIVSREEAMSGCGASVAQGPAGLSPLAVAFVALLLRRRVGRIPRRLP